MTVRCANCGHARSRHGTWWNDRDGLACHVVGCACGDFDYGCQCPAEILSHGMHLPDCPHPGAHAWHATVYEPRRSW